MAKHRIRRWFQFGILDLLILSTVVGAGAGLLRPVQAKTTKASPWVVGVWEGAFGGTTLGLYPDGYYTCADGLRPIPKRGFRWTVAPLCTAQDAFVLVCGNQRFVIRSEWGSGVIEVLNEDGSVKSRLAQWGRLEGPWCNGRPHGTWKAICLSESGERTLQWLEYRQGVPIGGHDVFGTSLLLEVNRMRTARGLSAMDEHDPGHDSTTNGKTP